MGSVTAARVAAPTLLDVIPPSSGISVSRTRARTTKSYTEAVLRLHDF
jgi:hypothetical protein